ncbi:MAG: membrane dipeptidase [Anaerolineae bacterium]|nr:membrane dipeptidase [Anaerolineae bacterium]NUQ03166.1 membrane dipeptidase [Anaerolineae bacterium]
MFIIDGHQDIAYNALYFGRDYRHSVGEKRAREAGGTYPNGVATLGLPDALLGRVALVFSTIFTEPITSPVALSDLTPRYKTPREAYRYGLDQLDYYNRLADENDTIRLVRTQKELDAVVESWKPDKPAADRKLGFVLLMENGDPILEPRQFDEWYGRGIRLVGPAWAASRYCGGTGQPGGLTADGQALLDIMANYNAILDLSHMAEQAFLESLDRYTGTVIASHSNPRRFRSTDRHLSDEMILRLAERGGVMGIVLFNRFLSETWQKNDPKSGVPFATILDAIDYVCQLTGSAEHVGIGSDLDGGFGVESIPEGLDSVASLWEIGEGLRRRRYSESDIDKILSGNFLRKLRETLPA